jgi:hypothetical protein
LRALALAGALLALAVAFIFTRPPAPTTSSPALRDFEAYYAAGATWAAHHDPYGRDIWKAERTIPGVVASRDEVLPFVGPPFSLLLWAALARLDYARACALWRTVLVLCLPVIALGSLRLAGGALRPREIVAALALCAAFAPLTSGLALGQAAIASCAGVVLVAVTLEMRRPPVTSIATFAAALQPNIGIALLGLIDRPSRWIFFGSLALVIAACCAIVLGGLERLGEYIAILHAHASAERFIAIQVTLTAALRALGTPPTLAVVIGAAVALLVIARTVSILRSGDYDAGARLAVSCAALPLVNPFAHEHDLAVALIAGLICLQRVRGSAWFVACAALLFVAVDWLGLMQRPEAARQSVFLALAAALAIVALRRERIGLAHYAVGAIALVVAALSVLARQEPLPIWPDALPLTFHASARLSISALWAAEQLRSGLGMLRPLSGALRLLSLGGCALLWQVCAQALRCSSAHREIHHGNLEAIAVSA